MDPVEAAMRREAERTLEELLTPLYRTAGIEWESEHSDMVHRVVDCIVAAAQ
jgi:hypothetical protein